MSDTDDGGIRRPNAYGWTFGTCLVVGFGLSIAGGTYAEYGPVVLAGAVVVAVLAMMRNKPRGGNRDAGSESRSEESDQREKELKADAGASGMK